MKVLVASTVREVYKNQFEYCIDKNLINFLYWVFGKKLIINIFNKKIANKPDLIIICGGNNIPRYSSSRSDYIRNKNSNYIYNYAIKMNIPLIGICYGSQFVGYKNNFIFKKKKLICKHIISLEKNIKLFKEKKLIVNSYKNLAIDKLSKSFKIIYKAKDGSVECFAGKKKKILGLMWHPERNKIFKNIDKKILRKFYDSNNAMRW